MAMHHPLLIGAPRSLRAPPAAGRGSPPALLQRSDDDFIAATLEALRSAAGQAGLRPLLANARTAGRVLKLYQPVQRQFHLALIELWCDAPGQPRVDPARIASAGLVLRRIRDDAQGRWLEGWMSLRGQLQGWVRVARLGAPDADPLPALRLPAPRYGKPLDAALRQQALAHADALLQERSHPLFLAPPDVCADAAKTLYYGLVPTSSSELAALPAPERESFGDDFGPDSTAFIHHLVEPLRGQASALPLAGQTLQLAWADVPGQSGGSRPDGLADADWQVLGSDPGNAQWQRLMTTLRQLASEFDALGSGPQAQAVMARLQTIRLPLVRRPGETSERTVDAASFVRNASRLLLLRDDQAPATEMPRTWPALADADASALRAALSAALRARFASVKGAPGRFDEPGALYLVQPFVRLKADGQCAARTLWGEPSEPFVIAPWYEGSGAPPVQISMPDPTTPGFLAALKPTVSFVVPPSLQGLLGASPKDMLAGKGKLGSGTTLGWICSFNLPIITICAFIVLNIFLSLFDIFLRWMLFIKICIPYPKRSDGDG